MEHLQHFGLTQDPFQNEPDLRFFFESGPHREAQRRMERGLRQSKGLCVLTGEPGTGKTLLARRVFEGMEEEIFEANLMMMAAGQAGAGSLLRRFAGQLEIDEPSDDPGALLGQVYEQLAVVREDGRHAVLIIDDAHHLSSDAMAEVGALLNLEYEDRRLVSVLLVGVPALDVALGREASLVQRVDVRVNLQSLNLDDSTAYLAHRLSIVGGRTDILTAESIAALHKYGRGRPRLMNTLADNALFEAFLRGQKALGAGDVERAAGDLGVGQDPGTTFTAEPTPPAISSAPPTRAPDPVVGELTDPNAADAMDTSGATVLMGLGNDPEDSALELDMPAGPDPSLAEKTTVFAQDPGASAGVLDLDDSLMDAEIDDPTGLPDFSAPASHGAAEAEATRLALPGEDGGENDEIDDLFVELLED